MAKRKDNFELNVDKTTKNILKTAIAVEVFSVATSVISKAKK